MANASKTAEPEEIAACILFLASDDASNVNGTILASDAGWSAK
jgi:NAD(P)-dependent dehydrogenase (short-subunit alcohol dehydrogenase family)